VKVVVPVLVQVPPFKHGLRAQLLAGLATNAICTDPDTVPYRCTAAYCCLVPINVKLLPVLFPQ